MSELGVGTRVEHNNYGQGIISKVNLTSYEIFFERGGKIEISRNSSSIDVIEEKQSSFSGNTLTLAQIEEVLSYVLDKAGALQEFVPLGEKWIGGNLIMQPSNPELKPKEIPIEAFFHKIVMLRDRLRVLEQNINSHAILTDEDKINLQQYITRIYGSLTTFNVLFSEKDHYFKGTGGK